MIGRATNDCGAMSAPKDSIQTCVETFDTAKHLYYSDRNTVFLRFLFIRHCSMWNDAQLRIAIYTITGFSCYGTLLQTQLFSDVVN